MKRMRLQLFLALTITALSGCGSDPKTPEEQIRALIETGEIAVEARDLSEVTALISSQYLDERGLDRRAVSRLIAGQFLTHQSIHLLVQTDEVRLVAPERAEALIYVAMSGAKLDEPGELLGLRADLFRFDLEFEKEEGSWRVTGGRWRRATSADFF